MAAGRVRKVLVPGFGARLAELRRGRSRQQIVNRAKALGIALDPSALFQYERGTVASPDPAALWALSKIYGVTLEDLVVLLVANRKDPTFKGDAPEVSADAFVITSEDDRALLESITGMSDVTKREVMEFIVFLGLRELQKEEREAIVEDVRMSIDHARRGAKRRGAAAGRRRRARTA